MSLPSLSSCSSVKRWNAISCWRWSWKAIVNRICAAVFFSSRYISVVWWLYLSIEVREKEKRRVWKEKGWLCCLVLLLKVVSEKCGEEERVREKGKKEEEVWKSTFYGKTFGKVDAHIEDWGRSNGGINNNVERFVDNTHWSFHVIIKTKMDKKLITGRCGRQLHDISLVLNCTYQNNVLTLLFLKIN